MKVAPASRHHAARLIAVPELLETRIAPATLYGVDAANNLYSFDSEAPESFASSIPITGLLGTAGETIVGMDFRPATGDLYAFSVDTAQDGHLYIVNEFTGVASLVGSITTPALTPGIGYGFDFNPLVDRIRVVNSAGENLRLNPNSGAVAGDDGNLMFGSPAVGPVDAIAYDRNFVGGSLTTVYGIDLGGDRLVTVGGINGNPTPNGGAVAAVGVLGVNATEAHLDIETGTGTAFAALTVGGTLGLYTIDLATGAATLVGNINSGAPVLTGFAVAPPRATIVNAKTATYLDADGDVVTVKVTKGTLDASDFRFIAARNGGGTLRLIDFSDDGTEFTGTNLTVTAAKKRGGDGEAHVGEVDASGIDLGKVRIRGDLARIVAGDADSAVIGLQSLQVNSMGRFGVATQAPDGLLAAAVFNGIGSIAIKGDLSVTWQVLGGTNGTLGSMRIGGSVVGGANGAVVGIFATGEIGSIIIGGDLRGGVFGGAGTLSSSGALGRLIIAGDVIGGAGNGSATIDFLAVRDVKIGGDIIGGAGSFSASLQITENAGKIFVGGGIYGGAGNASAIIAFGGGGTVTIKDGVTGGLGANSGILSFAENVGRVTLGNSLIGGAGSGSGSIFANQALDSLLISGSVVGGSGPETGQVFVNGATTKALITRNVVGGQGIISGNLQLRGGLDSLIVGGSIFGGSADNTGTLFFPAGAGKVLIRKDIIGGSLGGVGTLESSGKIEANSIASLTIGGSIIAGNVAGGGTLLKSGGVYVNHDIGAFTVKGSLIGNDANPVRIVTRGQDAPVPGVDVALGSLKVGKDVLYTLILAGYDAADFGTSTTDPTDFEPVNGNAQIGSIAVGRHWMASQVSAGIRDAGGFGFGGSDDQVINGFFDGTLSRIGSIIIKGQFSGRGGGAETFGIVAEVIGSLKIGSVVYGFDATEGQVFALTSITNDTFAREVIVI